MCIKIMSNVDKLIICSFEYIIFINTIANAICWLVKINLSYFRVYIICTV